MAAPNKIALEFTPNPNTLKYVAGRPFLEKGCVNFKNRGEANGVSDLATGLFGIPGVESVMIGRDFVTVTRTPDGDWDVMHEGAMKALLKHLESGDVAVDPAYLQKFVRVGESATAQKIIDILENEVRPAVARDGGDIEFDRYEEGVVYLRLRGACSGCPGAKMTLKMGVENRLRQEIPEILEVVSV